MKRRIDGEALLRDLDELAQIGRTPEGGVNRVAFTPADRAGREWVAARMRELGLEVRTDGAGNTIGLLPGGEQLPPIALGSHTDTVPNGGKYDGALGVLAALACVRAIRQEGLQLRHPLEVINFQCEEAAVGPGTLGSGAMSAPFPSEALGRTAFDGRSVAEHLRDAGIDPEGMATAWRKPDSLAAYLELHVEQGGTLAARRVPIGLVEGIVGIRRYRARFDGFANHAGTTPMDARDDALINAAPYILAVRDTAIEHGIVGTVGTVHVSPGAANVIPGRVDLSVELRGMDEVVLDAAEAELQDLATAGGGELTRLGAKAAVPSSARLVDLMEDACREAGLDAVRMSSGAGHDAMTIAAIAPEAMLFVPSLGGISHSPDEYTDPEHCVLGAEALLASLLRVDTELEREA